MTTTRAALLVFSFAAAPAFGAPPIGEFTIDVDDPRCAIWTHASYEFEAEDEEGLFVLSASAEFGPAGGASGAGTWLTEFDDSDGHNVLDVQASGVEAGTIKGSNGKAKAKVTLPAEGVISWPGTEIPLTGTIAHTFRFHPTRRTLSLALKMRLCAPENDCANFRLPSRPIELPPDQNGAWSLALDLVAGAEPNTITGTASATFEDVVDPQLFVVTGKYDPKRDRAKLELRDAVLPDKPLVTLDKLVVEGGEVQSYRGKFKLRGQKGTFRER